MSETKDIQDTLKNLIDQTYQVEKQYKSLSNSYENMMKYTNEIIESMGAAIWVVEKNQVKLQNTLAKENNELFAFIDKNKKNQEIEFLNKIYAVKVTRSQTATIILATDITDEKRSARLVSMGAIAAHLSHEIRNPIGSISLLTSSLLKKADEKNKPIIEQIRQAIFRVERIIKATLLFTKGVKIFKSQFDLSRLEEVCKNAISQYSFSKEIDFKFIGFQGEILADLDLLDLVFSNLIFNAIDAIEENDDESGEIILEHKLNKTEHEFSISDTGVKIDPKVVFEPFKTTKLKGNGLGLALSIEIINAHDGSMTFQNEPKVFTVSLP